MIQRLLIKNYALIEMLEISFSEGFTVLSGDTGSGKSIILDAISLILGKRSDRTSLFDKNQKCVVEIDVIVRSNKKLLFEFHNLDYENHSILRREITPSGKSRSFINDTPVSLSVLQDIASNCIEMYAQFQSNSFKTEDKQLDMIDKLSDSSIVLKEYQEVFRRYNGLKKKIENMKRSNQLSESEIDFLKHQISEIEQSNLQDGEKEMVESNLQLLENSSSIIETMSEIYKLMSEENGVISSIARIKSQLNKFGEVSESIIGLKERFSSIFIELDDLESEIHIIQNSIDLDPDSLNKNIARMDHINHLLSKHGKSTIKQLLDLLEEMKIKLNLSVDFAQIILVEKQKLNDLEQDLFKYSKRLTDCRSNMIPKFKKDIETHLKRLGIKDPVFDILLSEREEYGLRGKDTIQFIFSANKGSDPQEISKVASGGELSRLMLCFAYLVAEFDDLSCLIFDEIDSGVSGEIAYLMSDMMLKMSKSKQIISVTHLPQIASKADDHFKVYKVEQNHRTISKMKKLIVDERVEEIAKMLSGKTVTDISMSNARELLNL